MTFIKSLFGNADSRFSKSVAPTLTKINALEKDIQSLSDADFPRKTNEFKERIQNGETLDHVLPEAFALVREAAKRSLGQRHYDVQLEGGIALHQGKIAEMKTGEGKTLVATLATYLNALEGRGVHVVTVNDYLARRDAQWMGQIYSFLGMSVGIINSQQVSYLYDSTHTADDKEHDETSSFKVMYEFLKPAPRKAAYLADITYGTNNEFGFDYLRDNLVVSKDQLTQREHYYAIVDEIDSILIDEARTPLIISAPSGDSEKLYSTFADIATKLSVGEDYTVDEKHHSIALTDAGITKAEKLLGIDNIYTEKGIKYVHHLETAVRARALYIKDKEYVVKDGEVIIVDQFTGRLQPGRRYSEGIHQAVEAKEGVTIQQETKAAASITYQNYFRLYKKLSGMTGTAKTSSEEFFKVYGLEVMTIPTHRPNKRIDTPDLVYQSEIGKWQAIAKKVKELNKKGQPVLIGTISIEKNEMLSAYLAKEGVPHTILNAKNHEREGEIISQAGRKGSVVIATNMAGRGVDIALGGKPSTPEENEEVKNLGGLFVLGTERHEARRIDNQLRGRSGRQGDPGETVFFVSLEDDLMRVFGADNIKRMMGKFGIPEDQPIQNKLISRALESAQAKIEGFHFDARKYTLEYDNVMNHQRHVIYDRRRVLLVGTLEEIKTYIDGFIAQHVELAALAEEKKVLLSEETYYETLRRIILYVTDALWSEHLETMEYTRSSVNLRAYGQREPLIEYKKEGLRLFKELEQSLLEQVYELTKTIDTGTTVAPENPTPAPQFTVTSNPAQNLEPQNVASNVSEGGSKIGRNDSCPCGSGKKWKKCGMLNTTEHQKLLAEKSK
ncbi:preprotein translocase subunit SecA [Candidatus Nomurabacteria bacterium]|jgi:preprotein translocase subunit SecA|nr:MAG: preprotein translocase subunit SecA [Candidatus Nomurabacteria bacterium]